MNLTRALIPPALILVTGFRAPVEAQTIYTYTYPCWLEAESAEGQFWYAGGDDYGSYHFENSFALDWGYSPTYWYAQAAPGEPIRGVDHGESATFYVFVMADPLNPDAPAEMIVQAVHDNSLLAPRKTPSRKQ